MFGKLLSTLLISFHLFAILCASFSEENPTDRRVLVLLDDFAIKSSHSLFFKSLETRGFDLDFKLADDPKLALQRYGKYLYDAVILFSPTIDRFGGSIDAASLLEFVDSGHDLILAADASASELIREIAVECGVDFDEPFSIHVSFLSVLPFVCAISQFKLFGTKRPAKNSTSVHHPPIVIASNYAILSQEVHNSLLLCRIIHGDVAGVNDGGAKSSLCFTCSILANPKSKLSTPPTLIGSAISLVSIVQKLSTGFFCSSDLECKRLELLQSEHEKCGNEQFLTELSKWVFHERGHLKAVNVKHHKVGEKDEPSMYRIKDDLDYSVEVYEWSGTSWEPYLADDLQVQFYMMSPYVLKTLSTDQKGLYYTSFKVPDVYGVFQFKVEYQRLGYTSLSLSKQIPVRPFRHNEYERFIPAAYPYYGASFSMVAPSLNFLYSLLVNVTLLYHCFHHKRWLF
ncbi:hypothetical protein DH2020_029453 [Rehmannia glutinosa]|uniref:Dolichyl-diphosphooligosaccharide--protein glycosyltransferase 48 kDa subunit n=1 Tax=Rehmannia glutinosa TaxID=99300 RepID=A0ABR0VNL1_REHGL